MNFYLKSPYGKLNLDNLERCLKTRVSYFMQRKQESNSPSSRLLDYVSKNSDCLAIGSSYDMVGHFMLRLLIVYSSQMQDFLLESELDLFRERLGEKMEATNLIKSCRITLRHIEDVLKLHTGNCSMDRQSIIGKRRRQLLSKTSPSHDSHLLYLESLQLFCKSLRIPQIADHYMNHCNPLCTTYYITVPFQTCLNLVSQRKIHLNKGKAKIHCSHWRLALFEMFEFILLYNIRILRSDVYATRYLQDDVRVTNLFKEMKDLYNKFRLSDTGSDSSDATVPRINAEQVERESQYFPPCISNVQGVLKKIHRLRHNDRFYYSLFLKSIGLSLSESIVFWRTEYSKASCCSSVCSHSWQKNERQYVYGIRHLYGLEGSRKRYGPPDCHTIQGSMHDSSLDHACPFLYPNPEALVHSLSPLLTSSPSLLSPLLAHRVTHSPLESCRLYLSLLTGGRPPQQGPAGFESPTGYYFAMKYSVASAGLPNREIDSLRPPDQETDSLRPLDRETDSLRPLDQETDSLGPLDRETDSLESPDRVTESLGPPDRDSDERDVAKQSS